MSSDCIDRFDTEIIKYGLILSKIPEPKYRGRVMPLRRRHSDILTRVVSPKRLDLFCRNLHRQYSTEPITNINLTY